MVWYGLVRYVRIMYDMIWYGRVLQRMMWYDMAWSGAHSDKLRKVRDFSPVGNARQR